MAKSHYAWGMADEERPKGPNTQAGEKFIVRFPDGMRERIADAAKANNRSMNAEIVARLEMSLAPGEAFATKSQLERVFKRIAQEHDQTLFAVAVIRDLLASYVGIMFKRLNPIDRADPYFIQMAELSKATTSTDNSRLEALFRELPGEPADFGDVPKFFAAVQTRLSEIRRKHLEAPSDAPAEKT